MKKNKNQITNVLPDFDIYISNYINDINNLNIKLKEEKYNFLLIKLNNLIEEEPFKLFKKKHKNWEKNIEKLNNEIKNSYNDLLYEYEELEKIINNPTNEIH